jgi:hypothetical protein
VSADFDLDFLENMLQVHVGRAAVWDCDEMAVLMSDESLRNSIVAA